MTGVHEPRNRSRGSATDESVLARVTALLASTAAEHDRTGAFPSAALETLHRHGLLTATIGARFGGPQTGIEGLVRIAGSLGAGDPAAGLIALQTLNIHFRLARNLTWPEDLYASLVAESFERPTLLNSIRVEPELGSPSRGGLPSTRARRTSDGWSLSGRKTFATGAGGLAYHVVWAVTDEAEPKVANFLVRENAPGVTIEPTWDNLGLRASHTHDIVYRDVHVGAQNMIEPRPADDSGQQDEFSGIAAALAFSSLYLGVARAARDFFAEFAWNRIPTQLGHPIAQTDRIRSITGEITLRIVQAEELLEGLAVKYDSSSPPPAWRAFAAKTVVTRTAISAVEKAVEALGNTALSRRHPLERHLRDVLCARVHAPQDDTILRSIGKRWLDDARVPHTHD